MRKRTQTDSFPILELEKIGKFYVVPKRRETEEAKKNVESLVGLQAKKTQSSSVSQVC